MHRRLMLSVAMLLVGAGLLAASAVAGPTTSAAPQGKQTGDARVGGTFKHSLSVDIDYVDPQLWYYVPSWTIAYSTCSMLLNYPHAPAPRGSRLVPEVAQGFPTISRNGLIYTFKLKRTFRFHTGARVTAQSFADAFNRNARLKLASFVTRRGFMGEIVGANAVISGNATTISGVQVLGRYRLRVRLKRNAGDFIARLTMPSFCPILPGAPLDPRGMDKPPGSGPYYVTERITNRRIVLERNPYYRGGRIANPDRIVWTIDPDRGERLRATEQGANDFMALFDVPDAVVRNLADKYGLNRPGGRFIRLPSLSNYLFAFNHNRPVFRGARQAPLTKAINSALDRRALVGAHSYLSTRRTDRLLPAPLSRSRPLYPLGGPDPITARRWLRRAGHRPPRSGGSAALPRDETPRSGCRPGRSSRNPARCARHRAL